MLRYALVLLLGAFMLLLGMTGLFHLGLPVLAGMLRLIALESMVLGALLLTLTAAVLTLRNIYLQLAGYFASAARVQRRLYFHAIQKARLSQLLPLQIAKLQYVADGKRRQLLKANQAKQVNSLVAIIKRDLATCKHQMSKDSYRLLLRQLSHYRREHDMQSLLQLQQQLHLSLK